MEDDNIRYRIERLQKGGEMLGWIRTGVGNSFGGKGDLFTFLYGAKQPGLKGTNLYDYCPQIIYLGAKRNKKKELYVIGANTHYWNGYIEKTKGILRFRSGLRLPTRLIVKSVHAYRVDRIVSPVYRAIDIIVDPAIMTSEPIWRTVSRMPF